MMMNYMAVKYQYLGIRPWQPLKIVIEDYVVVVWVAVRRVA